MSLQDTQSDIKKQFLSYLIQADFENSKEVYYSQPGERTRPLMLIHRVADHILHLVHTNDKPEVENLMTTIEKTINNKEKIEIQTILKHRKTLSKILATNFYGQLNMTMIPSGATAGHINTPENKPADPRKSAKI